MRYLKYFEVNSDVPKVGDYVWCVDKTPLFRKNVHLEKQIKFQNFIDNNVGKIVYNFKDSYKVAFDIDETISKDILEFAFYSYDDSIIQNLDGIKKIGKYSNIVNFNLNEIEYFSLNKEDVELEMSLRKYNI